MTSYKAMSRLSPHINAGASARLNLQPMVSDLSGEAHAAFCHGWRSTDEAENRAGRTMGVQAKSDAHLAEEVQMRGIRMWDALGRLDPCPACGGGPVHCRHCGVSA